MASGVSVKSDQVVVSWSCRRFPILDVERVDLPPSIPILWSCESCSFFFFFPKPDVFENFIVRLHFQFWQFYNGLTLFRMSQLPQCKEWQVCVRHSLENHNLWGFKVFFTFQSCNNRSFMVRFTLKSKTWFLPFAGADVRLFLYGSLLRKLPHDSGCCLPEIQEQPGKVQNLIDDQ